jgi:hypothetical protein
LCHKQTLGPGVELAEIRLPASTPAPLQSATDQDKCTGSSACHRSGNPNGRPKGSRNRISETALKALADDFDAHGVAVIEKVRTERPHDYLKIIVAVLPRRMEIEDAFADKPPHKMTDDELEAIIWKTQRQLEAMGVEQPLSQDDLAQAKARRLERGDRE